MEDESVCNRSPIFTFLQIIRAVKKRTNNSLRVRVHMLHTVKPDYVAIWIKTKILWCWKQWKWCKVPTEFMILSWLLRSAWQSLCSNKARPMSSMWNYTLFTYIIINYTKMFQAEWADFTWILHSLGLALHVPVFSGLLKNITMSGWHVNILLN
jgi:hypothetical protein